MPRDLPASVVRNVDLGHGNFLLELDAAELAPETVPGQFFMIGIPGSEVLLRRPFSVCGVPGTFDDATPGALQFLVRVAGRGTSLLASLRTGAPLTVLGPLGRGFGLEVPAGVRPLFVAGGIGSAPFPALAAALARRGLLATMVYGARTARDLPLLEWFQGHCAEVVVATEDGSAGVRGLVTDPLRDLLAATRGEPRRLFACGPNPMLRAVAEAARAADVSCEMSLEAHMACGFGVCLGCVVPVRDGNGGVAYERVCVEGPVMPAGRLAW